MQNLEIIFDPIQHKYVDNLGNAYTSVTQLIGKYKPKFDELYWARYKANERGVSVEQVLNEWDIIRTNSQDRGTVTHEFLEDNVNSLYDTKNVKFLDLVASTKTDGYKFKVTNAEQLFSLPIREKMPIVFYKLVNYIKDGWTLYAEKRVFSYKYKIAGTIDLLLVRGNEFIIIDWKTNKDDLKFKSGYYKKEYRVVDGQRVKVKTNQWVDKKEFLDYPLNNLMNCKGTEYTLQLSLYSYLVEQYDLKCRKIDLFHIVDNNYDNIKLHPIEYIKNDIFRLLEFHNKQNVPITKNKLNIK